jgi:alcohol dehydrogenase (cytochrome c)
VGCAVQAFDSVFQVAPFVILEGDPYLRVFKLDQLQDLALMFIKLNVQAAYIYLVFFGLFNLVIGYLIFRSTFLPRILGVLMALSGLGWLTILLGVRASISAFDARSGKRIWRTYTVPKPDEPGGASWKDDTYKRGGGSTWITGVFDPASNITYWGTGNPGPWVADDRPGDNLYTDSTLALDIDNGQLKSYHQYTPHDSWDWDEVSAPLLIDTEMTESESKRLHMQAATDTSGFWIAIRDLNFSTLSHSQITTCSRRLMLRRGNPPLTNQSVLGLPKVPNSARVSGAVRTGCPRHGALRRSFSTSPQTTTFAVFSRRVRCRRPMPADFMSGMKWKAIFGSIRTAAGADHFGELQAWDLNTGKRVWQHNFKTFLWAPLLVTGGNLVFAGGTPDREFRAFDARTGNQPWSFPAPAGVIGVPTSFEVDGEQYIAVTAGWGLDAQVSKTGSTQYKGQKRRFRRRERCWFSSFARPEQRGVIEIFSATLTR